MTPEEIQVLEEKRKKNIDALRAFKDSEGYKVLCEVIRDQFTAAVRDKISNRKPGAQADIDAEIRAWSNVGALIDFEIQSYEHMVYSRLQQQGGNHAH